MVIDMEIQEKNVEVMSKELQEEMIGILTAISIVSKRLAARLLALEEMQGEKNKLLN